MCGEERKTNATTKRGKGTPPRVWGRVPEPKIPDTKDRDTPTCVGKSSCISTPILRLEGHPHVCGEERIEGEFACLERGTPPRVWGRVSFWPFLCPGFRDTPTCVGKSNAFHLSLQFYEGHPHVCGEEIPIQPTLTQALGTPPRVWGRGFGCIIYCIFDRDTPTCVGKSYRLFQLSSVVWGHPHVCGEEPDKAYQNWLFAGTPPRVWGRVTFMMSISIIFRDTPTCVGKRNPVAY